MHGETQRKICSVMLLYDVHVFSCIAGRKIFRIEVGRHEPYEVLVKAVHQTLSGKTAYYTVTVHSNFMK
jgi:hypothetical protein